MKLIGADIGQKRDPTCFVAVHQKYIKVGDRSDSHFYVRMIERLPLGTPYPELARRIGEVWSNLAARPGSGPRAYIDATGVGLPVVDLVRDYVSTPRNVWSVIFNHGDARSEYEDERRIVLGKAFLVSRLQVLLQSDRLHLPQTPEAKRMGEELLNYEIRIDQDANDRYGAFKVGSHDDLVTALGLAVQVDPRGMPLFAFMANDPEWE